MSASPYLDHLHSILNFTEDEGYDNSSSLTYHYTFNRTLTRESDFLIPSHVCSKVTTNKRVNIHFSENIIGVPNCNDFELTELEYCDECGWWIVTHKVCNYMSIHAYASVTNIYVGAKKVFTTPTSMAAVLEIDKLLKSGHKHLSSVNPILLEKSLAEVFRSYYKTEVKYVGGPGDNGIDLFAVIGDETFLIQVKRRSNGKAESVSVIRDLIGAYVLASNDITTAKNSAHVITSAPHFSTNAIISAKSESLVRFDFNIGLHAYESLCDIFGFASGTIADPWRYLGIQGHLVKKELEI